MRDIRSDHQTVRLITSAALRAAVAWSQRETRTEAWRELSRMTGVVMQVVGPSDTSFTPTMLIEKLHQPLSSLVGLGSPVSDVVLLNADGSVSDAAVDIACEYAEGLFTDSADPAKDWLPSWTWQRQEQVERAVYSGLIAHGDQHAYEATRRFLIEHPAGDSRRLVDLRNEAGARNVAEYGLIGPDRVWPGGSSGCWWPCPVCRWPMRVGPHMVTCDFRHHEARFRLSDPAKSEPWPLLLPLTGLHPSPAAITTDGSVCLELSVWRHITVPGVSELALEGELQKIPDVQVDMWVGLDAIDLLVQVAGRKFEVDVKDQVDPFMIAGRPPAAHHVVVPDYRAAQLPALRDLLPDKKVWTFSKFVKHIRTQGEDQR
ncbi:restriction endonuclease-related protein [Nocardia abscessus]|uniref:restriction endonuclease-related protein n=1 Tax=Nocardia abscessus TaxID=120957 RepID=UPI001C3F1BAD|nr:hypothetical protein [Nocardia abscessus]MCC3326477.1 hypothetical protein [Nocardia abscessus]